MADNDKRQRFLNIIRALESSDGKDLKHPELASGLHEGDAAVGQYALMPNTINYLLDAEKRDTGETPPYEHLRDMSSSELASAFSKDKNIPESIRRTQEGAEDYLAGRYADQLLNKYKDPVLAQAAWNQGHNSDPEDLKNLSETNPVMLDRAEKTKKMIEQANRAELIARTPQSLQNKSRIRNILDLLDIKNQK